LPEKIGSEFDVSDASVINTLNQYRAKEEVVFRELPGVFQTYPLVGYIPGI
jgi:hypothetical protein